LIGEEKMKVADYVKQFGEEKVLGWIERGKKDKEYRAQRAKDMQSALKRLKAYEEGELRKEALRKAP
jgi:hypothetical protein